MAQIYAPGDANRNYQYHRSQARRSNHLIADPALVARQAMSGDQLRAQGYAGYGGGAAGGGGGGGVGGGIGASYQAALNSANAANESRYQDILGGHNDLYGRAMNDLNQGFQQEGRDISDRYRDLTAANEQDLVSRGLSGSTMRSTMRAGMERERTADLNRLNEAHRRERLGYDAGLTGDRLGFMERRTDSGPDLNQMIALQQAAGANPQSGAGFGSYGRGGGGVGGMGGMGMGLQGFAGAWNAGAFSGNPTFAGYRRNTQTSPYMQARNARSQDTWRGVAAANNNVTNTRALYNFTGQ